MDGERRGWKRRDVIGLALGGLAAAVGGFEWLAHRTDWEMAFWSGKDGESLVRFPHGEPVSGRARLVLHGMADEEARASLSAMSVEVHAAEGAPGFVAWALPGRREAPLPGGVTLRTSELPVLALTTRASREDAKSEVDRLRLGGALRPGVYFLATTLRGSPGFARYEPRRGAGSSSDVRLVDPLTQAEGLPGEVLLTLVVEPEAPQPA